MRSLLFFLFNSPELIFFSSLLFYFHLIFTPRIGAYREPVRSYTALYAPLRAYARGKNQVVFWEMIPQQPSLCTAVHILMLYANDCHQKGAQNRLFRTILYLIYPLKPTELNANMADALTATFQLGLKVPDGRLLAFEASSHDSIRAVKEKITMKFRGVTFTDDVSRKFVEIFTYGNGIMVHVDGISWGKPTGSDGAEIITRVDVEGRMIRLGGKGLGGVTLPRLPRTEQRQLIARIRDVLEEARVSHNLPPPVTLKEDSSLVQDAASVSNKTTQQRDVLLLNGVVATRFGGKQGTGYVHLKTCTGKCGGRCYPMGQGSKAWGALLRGAAGRGDAGEVRRLLAAGTNPEDTSEQSGACALHFAARHGHTLVCELLLAAGSYSSFTDSSGSTPLDIARRHRHTACIALLEKAMNPCGDRFPGNGKHPLAPGASAVNADSQQWPSWLLKDIRHAHSKDMTDLESIPWAEGNEVHVMRDPIKLEALCRDSWAGWSKKKADTANMHGTVTKVKRHRPGETLRNGVLLEVLFESGERYWYPSRSVISDEQEREEDVEAVRKATVTQATADSIVKWRIVFSGNVLRDHETLWEVGVSDGDVLHIQKDNSGYMGGTLDPPRLIAKREGGSSVTTQAKGGLFESLVS